MKEVKLQTEYTSYETWEEIPMEYQELIHRARKATEDSWAPYSNFFVGCALLMNNGEIITGSNQENASYPIGLCAERTALSAAASIASKEKIKAMAITARNVQNPVLVPVAPCGICRQTIFEAECKHHQNIKVILIGESGACFVFNSIKDLLPLHFDAGFL